MIKDLFQNTLSPDPCKRKRSEEKLQELVANKDFIYSLPSTHMRDPDPIVRQVSATLFKNAVIGDLSLNAVDFAVNDTQNSAIYGEIIQQHVAKGKDYIDEFRNIVKNSHEEKHMITALLILNAYVEKDKSKFSDTATALVLGDIDPLVLFGKFKNCTEFRKIMAKIFENYCVPAQLLNKEFLCEAISHALNFVDKHSVAFLLRISTRSFKGLLNCETVRNDERVFNYFFNLQGYDQYKAEYFILYCQADNVNYFDRQDMLNSLIQTLIIPNLSYKDLDVYDDLKLKYNYSDDTYNSCSLLFADILKVSSKQDIILQYIKSMLESSNPKERYIGLSLYVQSEPLLRSTNMYNEFVSFVKKCLMDPFDFVRSQAFYALQLVDLDSMKDDRFNILNIIFGALNSENESIKTNAVICLPVFFADANLKHTIECHLPVILNTLVHNPLNLEQISETLETIIDTFDISFYAYDLCKKMLDNIKIDNIETTPYLRIISNLILCLEEKQNIVCKIYEVALPVLFFIFKDRKYDFYIEALDIVSNVLYVFKSGDQNVYALIDLIFSSDKNELVNCSEEMTCLLDNYISHCNVSKLENIVGFVDALCYQDDEYLFDEDFVNGCRIIESLILNGKYCSEKNYLEHFLKIVFDNYSKLDNNSLIYGLEVLLNALNVDICSGNTTVYSILKPNMDRYIQDMYENRKRFSRVHDKKIGLLFCANIMQSRDNFEIPPFLGLFMHLLYTYDHAVVTRQGLKNESKVQDDEDEEVEDNDSEEYLEEDIYFLTPLDNVDVKMFLKSALSSLKMETFGYKVFLKMDEGEKTKIFAIINN